MQGYAQATLDKQEGSALWRAMHEEVRGRRLMTPSPGTVLLKLAILLPLLGAALALAWLGASWLELAAGYAALALLLAQFAFIGHDAGHGSLCGGTGADRALGQVAMTLVTGLAFDEWIARHLAHHRFCQDETRDPDMAVDFVVSLTERSRSAKGAFGRFMTRHQALHVWALSFFFGHSQRLLSEIAVLGQPRRHALDAAMLALHFMLWIGLPCMVLDVSFEKAFMAYLIPLAVLGPYLAAIFWVNHVGMPLVRDPDSFSFFEHQYVTSRTIVNPPACDWLFGGLNFQIEHHLFPQVPSGRLPAVQAIVQRHFVARGLPYNGVTWAGAVRSIASHLRTIGRTA